MSTDTNHTKPRYRDAEWLREQYVGKGRTMEQIAEVCDCSTSTIGKWLKRLGIETRRTGGPAADERLTDAEWLRDQYVEQERPTSEIADMCDCSAWTVRKWLNRHAIETRRPGRHTPTYDRLADAEWLRERYIDQNLTTYEIAEICGCDSSTVSIWLNRHGIETRHPSEYGGEQR